MKQPSQRSSHDEASRPGAATIGGPVTARSPSDLATPSLADSPTRPHAELIQVRNVAEGTLVAGRYEILSRVGVGGMGEVWKARDRQLERVVAIKRIRPELAEDKSLLDRFFLEAKAVAALNHPHIVQIYDRGSDGTGEFFVMEFVDGPSLKRVLAEQGAFDIERTVRIGKAICDALQASHDKGFLHRDVKPANILLGPHDAPKLTDFGLARRENNGGHSLTKGGIGTPLYMSPEQHEPALSITSASDQWSLGATLYHLVTNQSPRVMRESHIPKPLRKTLMRAMHEIPQKRFSNMRQFGKALAQVIALGQRQSTTIAIGSELASIMQAMQAKVNEAHTEAQRLIKEDRDYAAATKLLSEVQEHLHKETLLLSATNRQARVAQLELEIDQRWRERRLEDLRPLIEELLELQPHRVDLRKLLSKLPESSPSPVINRDWVSDRTTTWKIPGEDGFDGLGKV